MSVFGGKAGRFCRIVYTGSGQREFVLYINYSFRNHFFRNYINYFQIKLYAEFPST